MCEAPQGWFWFESEQECRTSCRCGDVESGVERISLECHCQNDLECVGGTELGFPLFNALYGVEHLRRKCGKVGLADRRPIHGNSLAPAIDVW